jgi:hypothetical protein
MDLRAQHEARLVVGLQAPDAAVAVLPPAEDDGHVARLQRLLLAKKGQWAGVRLMKPRRTWSGFRSAM